MKKRITVLYLSHQVFYWSAVGGVVSFAAAYLPVRGFSAADVGWILFGAMALSFALQPLLASYADRVGGQILFRLLTGMSLFCAAMFLIARFFVTSRPLFALLYLLGVMSLDMQVPLLNSLSVYYSSRGVSFNYGLARGFGGFGFALATLGYGFLMEAWGEEWMPVAAVLCLLPALVILALYPRLDAAGEARSLPQQTSSLLTFIRRYKWYCFSLFGILFLAMFHAMVENYLIEVVSRFGGDSSHVGKALFIATVTELPMMSFFLPIWKRLGSRRILMVSAFAYIAKAVMLIAASSLTAIYLIQPIQCISYVFLSTVQVYYARESTDEADMVKGQSMITAFYTLGCALGNLTGGILISSFGVNTMLYAGLAMTLAGLAVFVLTLRRAMSVSAPVRADV